MQAPRTVVLIHQGQRPLWLGQRSAAHAWNRSTAPVSTRSSCCRRISPRGPLIAEIKRHQVEVHVVPLAILRSKYMGARALPHMLIGARPRPSSPFAESCANATPRCCTSTPSTPVPRRSRGWIAGGARPLAYPRNPHLEPHAAKTPTSRSAPVRFRGPFAFRRQPKQRSCAMSPASQDAAR